MRLAVGFGLMVTALALLGGRGSSSPGDGSDTNEGEQRRKHPSPASSPAPSAAPTAAPSVAPSSSVPTTSHGSGGAANGSGLASPTCGGNQPHTVMLRDRSFDVSSKPDPLSGYVGPSYQPLETFGKRLWQGTIDFTTDAANDGCGLFIEAYDAHDSRVGTPGAQTMAAELPVSLRATFGTCNTKRSVRDIRLTYYGTPCFPADHTAGMEYQGVVGSVPFAYSGDLAGWGRAIPSESSSRDRVAGSTLTFSARATFRKNYPTTCGRVAIAEVNVVVGTNLHGYPDETVTMRPGGAVVELTEANPATAGLVTMTAPVRLLPTRTCLSSPLAQRESTSEDVRVDVSEVAVGDPI